MIWKRFDKFATIIIAIAVLILPLLYIIYTKGMLGIFQLLAADSFYYMAIADHSNIRFYTFDQQHATTGFHPLWQILLTLLFNTLGNSSESQIIITFFMNSFLGTIGFILVVMTVITMTSSSYYGLLMFPGVYYLGTLTINPHYGASWSFFNGMESGLSIFFFGVLMFVSSRRSPPGSILLAGVLLSMIVLSRLDDIFLPIAFAVGVFVLSGGWREGIARAFLLVAPTIGFVGALLAFNYSVSGFAMPISGLVKSGDAFGGNLLILGRTLRGIGDQWDALAWRQAQMLIPGIVGLLFLWIIVRRNQWKNSDTGINQPILGILSLYVILKNFYNFFQVPIWGQGHWYFPISIISVNLIITVTASHLVTAVAIRRRKKMIETSAVILIFILIIIGGLEFVDSKNSEYNTHYYRFWRDRAEIRRELNSRSPGEYIFETDDGIINFSLGIPAMSGLGFALDGAAYEAFKNGEILSLAIERGFTIIGSSTYGTDIFAPVKDISVYRFTELYTHPQSGAVFIRMEIIESSDINQTSPTFAR